MSKDALPWILLGLGKDEDVALRYTVTDPASYVYDDAKNRFVAASSTAGKTVKNRLGASARTLKSFLPERGMHMDVLIKPPNDSGHRLGAARIQSTYLVDGIVDGKLRTRRDIAAFLKRAVETYRKQLKVGSNVEIAPDLSVGPKPWHRPAQRAYHDRIAAFSRKASRRAKAGLAHVAIRRRLPEYVADDIVSLAFS